MDIKDLSLKKHYEWKGKIEVISRVEVKNKEQLSLAYTPGVAKPCMEIHNDIEKSYELTRRNNLVAVITDGSAVLGLGNIGPEAAMPVMEGKCALFKEFADIDAFPICLKTQDTEELIRTIYLLSGSFGGINLEDIAAPRCFEIEKRLKEICDIPVFHDDQHGTAVVVGAALINALKLVKKDIKNVKCVINGAGSAGTAIAEFLMKLGMKNIIMCDRFGIICEGQENLSEAHIELSKKTNREKIKGDLNKAAENADVLIGVSAPGVFTKEMISSMNKDAVVFAMANPTPEIFPEDAYEAGAKIVGTGRSDYKNQINNVCAFPGIFRGALDARAKNINDEMKIAAAYAIAGLIKEDELKSEYILPAPFDERIGKTVAEAVKKAAEKSGVNRI